MIVVGRPMAKTIAAAATVNGRERTSPLASARATSGGSTTSMI